MVLHAGATADVAEDDHRHSPPPPPPLLRGRRHCRHRSSRIEGEVARVSEEEGEAEEDDEAKRGGRVNNATL